LFGIQQAGWNILVSAFGIGYSLSDNTTNLVIAVLFTTATSGGCTEVIPVSRGLPKSLSEKEKEKKKRKKKKQQPSSRFR
jgi:hypothetical protein